MIEGFAALDAEPVEEAEDDEGRDPLRRWRHVEEGDAVERKRQRRRLARLVPGEVGAGDRALEPFEVGGDLARDVAAVIVVEAGLGETVERVGEPRLTEDRVFLRRLAVDQKEIGEARHVLQLVEVLARHAGLRAGDRDAVSRPADRVGEKIAPRQAPAEGRRDLGRHLPAGNRPGDGQCRVRPARRDRVIALGAVALDRRQRPRPAAGVDGAGRPSRLRDDEEDVAADPVHVRIDDRDCRRRRDHRLEGIAAGPQHLRPGLGRRAMRRHDHALLPDHRFAHATRSRCPCRTMHRPTAAPPAPRRRP